MTATARLIRHDDVGVIELDNPPVNALALGLRRGFAEALDAAAKVLADAGEPMNAKQMIEAMTTQGLWKSPGGKTPHATLYSAILREIGTKGAEARFVKTDRGQFTIRK